MIAVVFGIQGVGKSSVVRKALAAFPENTWDLLQWGEIAYELCVKDGIIKVGDYSELKDATISYEDKRSSIAIIQDGKDESIYVKDQANIKQAKDEIRNLNIRTQKKIQKAVAKYFKALIENDPRGNFLIETHAALKTKQGYLPGLPKEFLDATDPDIFIILEANADEIFVRRLMDKERKREHDKTTKDVQTNLDTTRYFASSFATQSHSPLLIVENKEKRMDEAAAEIAEVLKKFME